MKQLARTALVALLWLAAAPASGDERPALFHTPPPQAHIGDPLPVEGLLVNGTRIARVTLHYRGPSEPYSSIRMERQYGDLFRAEIPGTRVVAPGVEYYVDGATARGETVALFMTDAHPARVLVVQNIVKPRPVTPPVETRAPPPPPPEPEGEARTPPRTSGSERRTERGADRPGGRASEREGERTADRGGDRGERGGDRSEREASEGPAPRERAEPRPPQRPDHPRTELDEELSLYSAEDRAAVVSHELRQPVSPELTTVVTREQIRAMGARSVMEVLRLLPGVTITREMGGFYQVGVRGLRSDPEVLFLLDGHVLNNFYDGRALANLPTENLARIELTRGPGTADLGQHAFAAVVNLVTLHPEGIAASLSGGTFATFDGHLTGGKTLTPELRVFGDADALYQSGEQLPVARDSLVQHTLAQHYREDASQPAGLTEDWRMFFNVGAGLAWGHEGGSRFTAQARFQSEERAALIGLFDSLGNGSKLGWTTLMADAKYELPLGEKSGLSVRAYFDDHRIDRFFKLTPGAQGAIPGFSTSPDDKTDDPTLVFPDAVQEAYRVDARRFGLDARVVLEIAESNRLTAGLTATDELIAQDDHLTNYDDADGFIRNVGSLQDRVYPASLAQLPAVGARNRISAALYAMDRWALLPELTIDLGIRVESFQLPRLVDTGGVTPSYRVELLPYVSPRVAVAYAPTAALVFKLSYSRAVRPPTVAELTDQVHSNELNHGRFEGSLALRPPAEDDVELWADLVQVAGESRVQLRGGAFYENFADAIFPVDTSGDVTALRNRLGVRSVGIEGEVRMDVSRRASVWANGSFFRDWDLETLPNFWLLTQLPQGRMNLGVSAPIGQWLNLDLTVETGTERRNASRSALEAIRRFHIPAYHLVTLQVRTEKLFDLFELALIGRNLFEHELVDDPYRPDRVTGFVPREGLSAFLTVRISL